MKTIFFYFLKFFLFLKSENNQVQHLNLALIKKNFLVPVIPGITNDQANDPRQGFPSSYTANGYLDIIKTKNIFIKKKYLGEKCLPFIIPKAIDIDDRLDLDIVNYLADKNYT